MRTWAEIGITIPSGRDSGEVTSTCPKCSPERKNKLAKCLSANLDKQAWVCHHCGWSGGLNTRDERIAPAWQKPTWRTPPSIQAIESSPAVKWFAKRGIPEAVLIRNAVTMTRVYMPQVEEEVTVVVFPYMRAGEVVNRKYRDGQKHFRMDTGAERILYRLDDIDPTMLVIVEGEIDALSVETAGFTSCVSVPDGAPAETAKDYSSKFTFLDSAEAILKDVKKFVLAVDNDGPGKKLEDELARRLGRERCWRVEWPHGCKDANETLVKHGANEIQYRIENAQPFPIEGVFTSISESDKVVHLFQYGFEKGHLTGWKCLDEHYKVRPGEFTVVTGIPGSGKALAVDTPIPTPIGFRMMGDLAVGDYVYAPDGTATAVEWVSEIRNDRDCWELTFDDGASIIADADHQWMTRCDKARRSERQSQLKRGERAQTKPRGTDQQRKKTYPSAKTTGEIAHTLRVEHGRRLNHGVALPKAIDGRRTKLPVDPYVLGAWLGDGTSACGQITSDDQGVCDRIRAAGYVVRRQPSTKYGYGILGLKVALRELGLLHSKHIPEQYLFATVEDRIALLQGLMDTDGYATKHGTCEFANSNRVLAEHTMSLVASLGCRVSLRSKMAKLNGQPCGLTYTVAFRPEFVAFGLPRKAGRQRLGAGRLQHRFIAACDPVPSVPVKCIGVAHPSHQFLAGPSFIPTHNSNFIDALLVNLANMHGWQFALFSPENQPLEDHMARMIEKYIGAPFSPGLTQRMTEADLSEGMEWVGHHFWWMLPNKEEQWEIGWILARASELVLRQGIKGLVIDPWNELESQRKPSETETEYVSRVLRVVRQWGRQHGVHVWMVVHPTKLHREVDGKYPVPTLYDCMGSSHWRNKADNGICVWRDTASDSLRPYEVDIHIQKIRFRQIGKLGKATLTYHPPTATYSDDTYPLGGDARFGGGHGN